MGGSDQWGNIVNGIDLIRRKSKKTVFGLTFKNARSLIKGIANFSEVDLNIFSSINRFCIWIA